MQNSSNISLPDIPRCNMYVQSKTCKMKRIQVKRVWFESGVVFECSKEAIHAGNQ